MKTQEALLHVTTFLFYFYFFRSGNRKYFISIRFWLWENMNWRVGFFFFLFVWGGIVMDFYCWNWFLVWWEFVRGKRWGSRLRTHSRLLKLIFNLPIPCKDLSLYFWSDLFSAEYAGITQFCVFLHLKLPEFYCVVREILILFLD